MERQRTTIIVEVDLDPVPGWGNNPEDYVNHVERLLKETIPHYNPKVRRFEDSEYIRISDLSSPEPVEES